MNKNFANNPAGLVLLIFLAVGIGGCTRIHEPWVVNGKAYKEQHFQMNVPEQRLEQRTWQAQTDR